MVVTLLAAEGNTDDHSLRNWDMRGFVSLTHACKNKIFSI